MSTSAPERKAKRPLRGTVVIDTERCKGCELCIPACPPGVLHMSANRNDSGYLLPVLTEGCTGCSACLMVCPDFCFEVYQFDDDGRNLKEEGRTAQQEATS